MFDAANGLCWAGATFGDPSSCTLPSGDTAYTYTANGDRLGFGTTALRYDLAHRLTKATIGSVAHTFTYDALGNRSKDTGPTTATTTTYDWDPNGSLPMMASAKLGSTQKDFFYGGGLQAMRLGSTIYYYDQDQMGSVSNILKANGTLEYSYSYQPYGQFRSNNKNDSAATANFNPMVFDSEYADLGTTGFVDLRAREYDPGTATFLTADPIGGSPDYSFAGGNPTMLSDPSGLISWKKAAAIVLGVAAVVGIAACIAATEGICAGVTLAGLGGAASGGGALGLACEQGACQEAEQIGGGLLGEGSALDEAFHYTFSENLDSILDGGLAEGSFATTSGELSPLQAQIELGLQANRGLPDALLRIDLSALREAGYQIPELTRVLSNPLGGAGGGDEMTFPYRVLPGFLKVVR